MRLGASKRIDYCMIQTKGIILFSMTQRRKSKFVALMLDELTIQEGQEKEEEDSHQITLSNDLEVTFDLMPTFTISGLNQFDTISLLHL